MAEMSGRDGLAAFGLFALAAALYLAWPSRAFVFEGLLWALPIDTGRTAGLFHGNYLLFGPLAFAFHHALRLVGGPDLAVFSIQALDALLGAAAAAVFFAVLRALDLRRGAAFAWTLLFSVCLARWKWCTEAEVYAFSSLSLACALLGGVLYARGKLSELSLGLLHAFACLAHAANGVLLLPFGLLILRRRKGAAARGVATMVLVSAAVGLAAYGLALAVFVRPASAAAAWHWLLGSADTAGGAVNAHRSGGLFDYLATTGRVFLTTGAAIPAEGQPGWPPTGAEPLIWAARALLAAAALAAAFGWRRLSAARRETALFCAAWLLAYALVFTTWEPTTLRYRIGDAGPLVVLLALGLPEAPWLPAALAAAVGAANLRGEIAPVAKAENNPNLQRMLFYKDATHEGDWITARGGREELYVPYFAQRRALGVGFHEADPRTLASQAAKLAASGAGVYATEEILADPKWAAALSPLHPREATRSPKGWALFRLSPPR